MRQKWPLLKNLKSVVRNLGKLGTSAERFFTNELDGRIEWRTCVLTADEIIVFDKAKDRPVLTTALSCKPAVLLTLDRADFQDRLGNQFYGIDIRTPGEWLMEQRSAGLI